MTTTTYQSRNHSPVILYVFVLFALTALLFTLPQVIARIHAEAHPEAAAIRACWEKGDILQRWVKVDLKAGLQRDYCLFQLPTEEIGCRIVQLCKSLGWLEITAFKVGDGTLETTEEYLKRHNCERVYP